MSQSSAIKAGQGAAVGLIRKPQRGDPVLRADNPESPRQHGNAHALANLGHDICRRNVLRSAQTNGPGRLDRHLPALPLRARTSISLQRQRHQPAVTFLADDTAQRHIHAQSYPSGEVLV